METIIIKNQEFIRLKAPVCAAIGNFDGVHLGHQQLINESKKHGYKSAVLTLNPHPSIYLKNLPDYQLITPIEHKIEIIKKMNIDYLIIIEFDEQLAMMNKNIFIEKLKFMNIKACVCGYDFTFGYKALGNISDLAREFEFYEIPKYLINNVRVSSSYTRELLANGNVKEVINSLGRNFSIQGEVIHGNKIGSNIGFPTANLDYGKYFLPKNGVYMCKADYDGKEYLGVCNIGNNPTLNFSEKRRLEVHILNFNQNIYGEKLEVFFYDRLRNERKFISKEDLLAQIALDKQICLENKKYILGK